MERPHLELSFPILPHSIQILLFLGSPPLYESELIPLVTAPHLQYNSANEILLFPIISHLKVLGYKLEHTMIWYHSQLGDCKVYCGNDPLPLLCSIPTYEITFNQLILICRDPVKNNFGTVATIGTTSNPKQKPEEDAITNQNASRRTKERKIGFIVERVSQWRNLYKGILDSCGELNKLALDDAADQVGISKKSLDDYLLQIRFGRRFGFNFQEHKDDKVGVLRAYVKKCKNLQVYAYKMERGEDTPKDIVLKLQEPGTPACKHNRCCYPSFASQFKRDSD